MHFDELRGRWGGRRERAGRRSGGRGVTHDSRPRLSGRGPAMITWKLRAGTPSLRSRRAAEALRGVFRAVRTRTGFRVVHYSIQRDHIHLIVEADGQAALSNGLNALGARLARRVIGSLRAVDPCFASDTTCGCFAHPVRCIKRSAMCSATPGSTAPFGRRRSILRARGASWGSGAARRVACGAGRAIRRSRGRGPGCWRSDGAGGGRSIRPIGRRWRARSR